MAPPSLLASPFPNSPGNEGIAPSERSDPHGTGADADANVDPEDRGQGGRPVRWDKALWRRQPFEDNYVPPDFLSELDRLPPRPRPQFIPLFLASLPISLHLSIIAIFLSVFYGLLEGSATPSQVGWGCVGSCLAGWAVWSLGWGVRERSGVDADPIIPTPTPLRSLILPPLLLSLLSPVLGTLTSATTSDSIWPLAAGLGFVHLLLADFGTGEDTRLRRRRERARRLNAEAEAQAGRSAGTRTRTRTRARRGSVVLHEVEEEKSLTSSLSLTSALSASVVLASRLPSTSHVFSLVLLAVLLFAGWPRIAKGVREAGRSFSLILTISTAMLAFSLFPSSHPNLSSPSTLVIPLLGHALTIATPSPSAPTAVFLLSLTLVNVVGPLMLIYGWRWKTRRGGGWDVAVVRIRKGRPPGAAAVAAG